MASSMWEESSEASRCRSAATSLNLSLSTASTSDDLLGKQPYSVFLLIRSSEARSSMLILLKPWTKNCRRAAAITCRGTADAVAVLSRLNILTCLEILWKLIQYY